jgi:hypothetical protein
MSVSASSGACICEMSGTEPSHCTKVCQILRLGVSQSEHRHRIVPKGTQNCWRTSLLYQYRL